MNDCAFRKLRRQTALLLVLVLCFSVRVTFPAAAETVQEPDIASEGAALYNATTGEFLYKKNSDTAYYPASITKILTALLVIEKCQPDDTVTFTDSATTNLESGAVTLGLTAGDTVSVRDCLYAILLKSANEAANGLAEHTAGSVSAFAAMMNEKAASLGCTGSHFANPNGLDNADHYTTPHDMALIAKACFENETFRKIDSTVSYSFPATLRRPNGTTIVMGHKMIDSGNSQYYEGILGGKTGYTSAAGNTLVTCAERNGVRLIAVVMKSRSTHYADTKALLDYGFAKAGNAAGKKSGSTVTAIGSGKAASGTSESKGASYGPGVSETPGWNQNDTGWFYVKDNGKRAQSERLTLNGFEYWFDDTGYMATGWRKDAAGNWYYLRPSFGGMKKSSWIQDDGKWYYLGADGKMLVNGTAPDGCRVDRQGVWIE